MTVSGANQSVTFAGAVNVASTAFANGSAAAPSITFTGDTNTGIFSPGSDSIGFAEGGAEVMRLDSSGNLGLGVTPSAWGSGFRAFEVGRTGSGLFSVGQDSLQLTCNYYFNGTNYIYAGNGFATRYHLTNSGQHQWFNAPSGTAGNAITFTQAMTLDASGNLGIGETSPNVKLHANGDIRTTNSASNFSRVGFGQFGSSGTSFTFIQGDARSSGYMAFYTNVTERMRVTANGALAFNGASNFGSSGQVLQSNGDAAPTWVTASSIGVGQSWTNVGGSRSSGTTYTNSTGRAIQLMVATDNTGNTQYGSGGSAKFFINGNNVGEAFCSNAANVGGLFQAIIPPSSTYQVSASIIRSWWELR
jgi:hypothetical protein